MNSRHRKTLASVFTDPVSGSIEWMAIEGLLLAAGAQRIEGRGSRVRFKKMAKSPAFTARILARKRNGIRFETPVIFWSASR